LKIEAIQRVDDIQVLAVRWASQTVRFGQVYSEPCVLSRISDGEQIAREGGSGHGVETEESTDASRLKVRWQEKVEK
jgi:hypothetical protein